MPIHIDNPAVFVAMSALAIPILLHLLQRRRHDMLDWGAMQFLPDSMVAQRRRWLDEILLMLLRMAVIALIVLALATPTSTNAWIAALGDHSSRDVVIVLDGSYSMDVRVPNQSTPWAEAIRWTRARIDNATRGERFSVLVARQPPVFLHEEFGTDFAEPMPFHPLGNPDMPGALAQAWRHLQTHSKAASKEIVVVTDGQQHGWADPNTLSALDLLGQEWRDDAERAKTDGTLVPSISIIKVGESLPEHLPNYSLAALSASRRVVKLGQKVTFRSTLRLHDFPEHRQPRSVKVVVDGVETQRLELPADIDLKSGQIPLTFQHRFDKVGQHVVSLLVDADDALPVDNEQRAVVDAVKDLPILIIDGDDELSPESSSYFLRQALAAPAISHGRLSAAELAKPAVVMLADVPHLNATQIDALDRFLDGGGGLLIVAGERVAKARAFYNDQLYRQGDGWLPAMLIAIAVSKDGVQPEPGGDQHPALEFFRGAKERALKDLRFKKWSQVQLDAKHRATLMATFTNGDPFLIERPYKNGKVILCTVPLDRSWDSPLPALGEFPILVHELTYYLAGNRVAAGVTSSVVAPPDLRESQLARCNDDDWRKVRACLPLVWRDANDVGTFTASRREEIWWLLLLAVIALLCMEVWLTRRLAVARG